MFPLLGCVLVVAGLLLIARWRSRWSLPFSVLAAGAGCVVIAIASREPPPDSTEDDVTFLCKRVSIHLDDDAFAIVFSHPRAPRVVSSELRAQHALVLRVFHSVADICVKTPESCERILASADPTTADFHWHVNYVASMMRRRAACVEPVPSPPADYPWRSLR